MDEKNSGYRPGRPGPGWLIGADLRQAGKRILWGGGAGLAYSAIYLIVIVSTFFGDPDVAGVIQPGGEESFFILAMAGVIAVLAVGVLKRNRAASVLLLCFFVVVMLALFGLAAFGLGPGKLQTLPFHLVFAYLFFQGMRGVLTWHSLTRPGYTADAVTNAVTNTNTNTDTASIAAEDDTDFDFDTDIDLDIEADNETLER